jgi:glycine cleavage system protein P-like pyridoxal-binding family
MFDDPHRAKTAVTKLTQLRQGRRAVVAYAAEFRRIVMDADFDNNAQVFWFRSGLADAILDELTHTNSENDLDKFIDQCILIDTRLRERDVERKRKQFPMAHSIVAKAPTSDPMVIDSLQTSPRRGPLSAEERKRRIEKDLCLYCGNSGHRKVACPLKPGNGQARQH